MAKYRQKTNKWKFKIFFLDGKSLIPKKIIEKIDFLRQNWGKNGKGNMQKIGAQNMPIIGPKNLKNFKFISQGN